MIATTLGNTGLAVTRIGLGLAALGRPAYITLGRDDDLGPERDSATMQQRCHDILDLAYRAGVRYVDAARSYGRAEEFLASWLASRPIAPDAITVGSKWGYRYVGDWDMAAAVHEIKDHSLAMFRDQLAQSTALLGPHLDLYQVHSATLESGVLDDRAVLHALAELVDNGVTVGLTVSGPRQADVVRHALELGVEAANPFSTVQATWNVLEPSVGPALVEARARGWGVLVKEALANGRLTGWGHDRRTSALEDVAARHGASVDQVAIAAALGQPWADVVLSGPVTAAQLESNLTALELTLSDEDWERLASVVEDPTDYWDRRSALPWS
ncbi:MAG TPA: aldo/keto reductase [Acidimicrobiales bacterium]|nr:aldo/keto reductase [Acidimicrobiales bacterium]